MSKEPNCFLCKHCRLAFGLNYRVSVWELRHSTFESTPDGTGRVSYEDAGVFCSRACILDYLRKVEEAATPEAP